MMMNEQVKLAAEEQAIVVDQSDLGLLKITGETRLDLIHRMSTQAVKDLKVGEGAATVLTTDIARIIDRLILAVGEDVVYALTGAGNGDGVARYLMRYVFFNDDFHLEDLSGQRVILGVYGPKAATAMGALGVEEALERFHWREGEVAGEKVRVQRVDSIYGDGYLVVGSEEVREDLLGVLAEAGCVVVSAEQFEAVRVEAGVPRYGAELTGDYIPLEANLWDDISFQKGCYIGQEIIARMDSRGQLAKRLVRLRVGGEVMVGAGLLAEGKKAGTVTSVAGKAALGYVRTKFLESGVGLVTEDGVDVEIVDSKL
ncbi:MAG TPA: glycine cleavage system protein T [Anaerolineae bacterium]|nr:glycine cleavage system protein T [Anaerolineae bacterium]